MAFVNQLVVKTDLIPTAITFSGAAVGGGFLGTVVRVGYRRGVFSDEAGLGSASIVNAASKIKDLVTKGFISICSIIISFLKNFESEKTEKKAMISGYNNKH